MISGEGIELARDFLSKNTTLQALDVLLNKLGVVEGSIRKNSLGINGAMNLSAIIIQNKSLV